MAEYLSSMHESLGPIPSAVQTVMMHNYNSSAGETEAEGSA